MLLKQRDPKSHARGVYNDRLLNLQASSVLSFSVDWGQTWLYSKCPSIVMCDVQQGDSSAALLFTETHLGETQSHGFVLQTD